MDEEKKIRELALAPKPRFSENGVTWRGLSRREKENRSHFHTKRAAGGTGQFFIRGGVGRTSARGRVAAPSLPHGLGHGRW